MELFSSLILTKFRLPVPRSRAISRNRLLQKLPLEPDIDLVLVCAPAGYGKTTLLVEWAQTLKQTGMAIAWYSLDERDNSSETFGSYLIASLVNALGPGSGLESVGQVLRASPEIDLRTLLPMVINNISSIKRDVVLVLDDYHLIKNTVLHQVMEFLLNYRSDNLHLVIGSRTNPPFSLARLRAKNRLIEIRVPDLRFTIQETHCFLRDAMQLNLSEDLSNRLAEQVEGWAAGLQLAALSISGREDTSHSINISNFNHREITEYLLEEVVNNLPEDLQGFLLYSSILERMSASICDDVLNLENSDALLRKIEQLNLFIFALDDENPLENWYRYHNLFKDFLQSWLNRSQPGRAAELHHKAANWFASHGLLREAAYHAFRCGDWQFAVDFVEQYSFTMIIQSEIATIYEWCSAFPESILRDRPKLSIFQGLALAFRFQGKNRARVEACIERANQAMITMNNSAQEFEIHELTAVVQTLLAMIPSLETDAKYLWLLAQDRLSAYPDGDPGRFTWLLITAYANLALTHLIDAEQFLEKAIPLALQSGLYFGYVEGTFHLARLKCSQGKLQESVALCKKAQTELNEIARSPNLSQSAFHPSNLPALGCLDIITGCVFLELNDLEEADRLLHQGLARMGWSMNPYYLMTAYLAQFRLFEIQGRLPEAFGCLDQLNTLWPDLHGITQGLKVQSSLNLQPNNQETIDKTREWLNSYLGIMEGKLPVVGLGPIGTPEAYNLANITWLRLQVLLGNIQEVQSILEQQLYFASKQGLFSREIELRLIQAQMFYKGGQENAAFDALETALKISHYAGYVSVFLQNPLLDELIHKAALKGIRSPNLQEILFAIRRVRGQKVEISENSTNSGVLSEKIGGEFLVEPLTERELEILKMVSSGVSNQTIAEQLVITVGTVKSHIHNIFVKLGVRNRTEAVSQARKLGFIK